MGILQVKVGSLEITMVWYVLQIKQSSADAANPLNCLGAARFVINVTGLQ